MKAPALRVQGCACPACRLSWLQRHIVAPLHRAINHWRRRTAPARIGRANAWAHQIVLGTLIGAAIILLIAAIGGPSPLVLIGK